MALTLPLTLPQLYVLHAPIWALYRTHYSICDTTR